MPSAAVGLYCAVVDRFDLWVPVRRTAARETQAVFNQQAESLRTWLGALNLGSGEGWQREPESGAARTMGVRPQPSAVGIDDGAADREADSHSVSLGGVEGFANPPAILWCDVGALRIMTSRPSDGLDFPF
jgi:hypothetical protein